MIVGKILSALGGQGPTLLVISLCAGLLIDPLAHLGYEILPFSAFLLTLGSFLTAGLAPSEAKIRPPLMALVVGWVGLALPLAAAVLLSLLPLDPRCDVMFVAAIVANFGLCALATLTFARLGLQTAGTIGLVSGNRNVTLVWAAASFGLPSLAEGYVAACVIPVLALPLIVKLCLKISLGRFIPQRL